MALLDQVETLVNANLNDLVDRAENPEKMQKPVVSQEKYRSKLCRHASVGQPEVQGLFSAAGNRDCHVCASVGYEIGPGLLVTLLLQRVDHICIVLYDCIFQVAHKFLPARGPVGLSSGHQFGLELLQQ